MLICEAYWQARQVKFGYDQAKTKGFKESNVQAR